jgi:hypothetical protein
MKTLKDKLVERLLNGSGMADDIFTEFVVVGLEDTLETICKEVERLLGIKNLSPIQQTDLNELYHDGKATIRVLQYYTTNYYHEQGRLINKAWDKLLGEVF